MLQTNELGGLVVSRANFYVFIKVVLISREGEGREIDRKGEREKERE